MELMEGTYTLLLITHVENEKKIIYEWQINNKRWNISYVPNDK